MGWDKRPRFVPFRGAINRPDKYSQQTALNIRSRMYILYILTRVRKHCVKIYLHYAQNMCENVYIFLSWKRMRDFRVKGIIVICSK